MVIKNKTLKKNLYLFILPALIILIAFVYAAVSNPGHSSEQILIKINGYSMTLQEAIDNEFLMEDGATPIRSYTTNINPSHSGGEIKINLGGTMISIQQAIDTSTSFCRDQTSIFSGALPLGHGSDKVEITIDGEKMTLQNAINTKKFCKKYTYSWVAKGDWSACSVSCGGGTQTQTVICQRSDGTTVSDSFCTGTKPSSTRSCNTQACPTCSDGIQNQGETGVDCGGPCSRCSPFPTSIQVGSYTYSCSSWTFVYDTRWSCRFPRVKSSTNDGYVFVTNDGDLSKKVTESPEVIEWCAKFGGGTPGGGFSGAVFYDNPLSKRARFSSNAWIFETSNTRTGSIACLEPTVLCTEANRQGILSDELLSIDAEFARKYIDSETMLGYHSWAKPLVEVMQESPNASEILNPLILEWAHHMAYLMGVEKTDSETGKMLLETGLPISKDLGKLLSENGYTINNEYIFDKEIVKELFWKYSGKYTKEEISKNQEEFQQSLKSLLTELKEYYIIEQNNI